MKKLTFLFTLLFSFSAAMAQTETTTDTIYSNNSAVAILKKIGTGYIVYSTDGKLRLISIKENYYRFANNTVAYPDVTVRSVEKTIEVILANGLVEKTGLNENKINAFVAKHPTPLPVQQMSRESREEINPEIR